MYTVTFVQLAPPSRVTCTCPSSVPTQMTFGSFVDGVIRMTALKVSAPELSFTTGPPDDCCLLLSFSVRSGLIGFQVRPRSSLLKSTFPPAYSTVGLNGETAKPAFQLKRYGDSATPPPLKSRGYGWMSSTCSATRSKIRNTPFSVLL